MGAAAACDALPCHDGKAMNGCGKADLAPQTPCVSSALHLKEMQCHACFTIHLLVACVVEATAANTTKANTRLAFVRSMLMAGMYLVQCLYLKWWNYRTLAGCACIYVPGAWNRCCV